MSSAASDSSTRINAPEFHHKHHAQTLLTQVKQVLTAGPNYLMCDRFAGEGDMPNDQFNMSVGQQTLAPAGADLACIECLLLKGSLAIRIAR